MLVVRLAAGNELLSLALLGAAQLIPIGNAMAHRWVIAV